MNHKLSLRDWLAERRDNARSLAASPMRSSDSAGWQEDASYFQRAIDAIAACEASAGAVPSDKKYLSPASISAPQGALPVQEPIGCVKLREIEGGIDFANPATLWPYTGYEVPGETMPLYASPADAAPVAPQERLLTEDEVHDAYAMGWTGDTPTPLWLDRIEAIQRKFCEVNGLKLAAKEQTAFKRVGTDLNEKPAEAA